MTIVLLPGGRSCDSSVVLFIFFSNRISGNSTVPCRKFFSNQLPDSGMLKVISENYFQEIFVAPIYSEEST